MRGPISDPALECNVWETDCQLVKIDNLIAQYTYLARKDHHPRTGILDTFQVLRH